MGVGNWERGKTLILQALFLKRLKMEKIFLLFYFVAGCHCAEKTINIAIVNSTTTKDLRTQIPPEEKYVAYVYAKSVSIDLPDLLLKDEKNSSGNQMGTEEKYCVVRVEEDSAVKYYEGTIQQVRDQGKNVIDLLCEGDLDPNGDKALSKGAIASLVGYG